MSFSRKYILLVLLFSLLLVACQQEQLSSDPNLKLSFSKDTISFDTVFTTIGSATQTIMIYNNNNNALNISQIYFSNKQTKNYFHINIDGESDISRLRDIEIRGKDSLFMFVEVNIDPQDNNNPVYIEEQLQFLVNGKTQSICLTAFGQDVHLIRTPKTFCTLIESPFTFDNDKPYLIYDTLLAIEPVTIKEGATLYMHQGACLYAYNDLTAEGSLQHPIRILGDRRDNLFDSVPYAYAAGAWNGIYLLTLKDRPNTQHKFDYVEILGANVGLYCEGQADTQECPTVVISNSKIHNHAIYGLVLQNTDATVVNTEISNAAAYCLYLAGGNYQLLHNTIASYFNSTNIRIQSTPRQDVAALYINNLNKQMRKTRVDMHNCIVTGVKRNQMVLATPITDAFEGNFTYNYLKTDTLPANLAANNIYWQETDTAQVFLNTYYEYQVYEYYNFHLDSLSPARQIADTILAQSLPHDRDGVLRIPAPDAGCYQYVSY